MARRRPGHVRRRSPARRRSPTAGSCCRAWSTRTATSASAPAVPRSTSWTRRGRWPSSTGTPACWRSATPARRSRTPSSTTTRRCPAWPGPAGTSPPPKRYLRDIGVEVPPDELPGAAAEQAAAGNGWVKLVGDWIDRDVGDLAPTLGRRRRWPPRSTPRTPPGARVAVHTFGEESVAALVRAGVDSVEHGTGLSDDGHRRDGPPGHGAGAHDDQHRDVRRHRGAGRGQVPGVRRAHAARCGTGFPAVVRAAHEAGRADLRRHRRRRRHRARRCAGDEMLLLHAAAGMSTLDVLRGRPPGAPGSGWASPAWSRAAWPTWSSTRPIRAPTCAWSRRRAASCCAAA